MTSYNLSLCIAPTILWAKKVDGFSLAKAVDWSAQQIVEYLIKNSIELFGGEIVDLFEDLVKPLECSVRSLESITNMNDDTSLDTLSGIMYNSSGYPSISSFNKCSNFFQSRSGDHLYFDNEPINQMHGFDPIVQGNTFKHTLRRKSISFADSTSLSSQLKQYQSSSDSLVTDHTCFTLGQSWHNYSEMKDYNDQWPTADTSFKKSFQSVREFKDDSSSNASHLYSIENSPKRINNKSTSNGIGDHFYSSQSELNRKHHTPISHFQTSSPFKPARYENSVSDMSRSLSQNNFQYAPPTSFPFPCQHQGFVQTPVHNTHVNLTHTTENDHGWDTIHKYGSVDSLASRPKFPPCYDEALRRKTKFEMGIQKEGERTQYFNETNTKSMYEYKMQSPYKQNVFVGTTSECGSKQNDDLLEPYLFKKYQFMRKHEEQ